MKPSTAETIDGILEGLEGHVAAVLTDLNLLELYLRAGPGRLLTPEQYGQLVDLLTPIGRAAQRILERDLQRTADARR